MPSAVINDVAATFSYLQWQDRYNAEKPYQILIDLPDGTEETQRTNLVFCDGPKEKVADVTGREASFTLDRNGFAFIKDDLPIRSTEFADRTMVESVYLPACERIIRETLDDVDEVVFYNWRVSLPISRQMLYAFAKTSRHGRAAHLDCRAKSSTSTTQLRLWDLLRKHTSVSVPPLHHVLSAR